MLIKICAPHGSAHVGEVIAATADQIGRYGTPLEVQIAVL